MRSCDKMAADGEMMLLMMTKAMMMMMINDSVAAANDDGDDNVMMVMMVMLTTTTVRIQLWPHLIQYLINANSTKKSAVVSSKLDTER